MLQEAKQCYEVANLQNRNTAADEVHPAGSCSWRRSWLVENGREPLRYATIETPFFFSIIIIFLFFSIFFFFSEGVGGRGTWLRYLFVCLLSFKFFKVCLRRVENAAVGENPAPNERRVLKEDRSCNCPHRTFTSELTSDSNKRRV